MKNNLIYLSGVVRKMKSSGSEENHPLKDKPSCWFPMKNYFICPRKVNRTKYIFKFHEQFGTSGQSFKNRRFSENFCKGWSTVKK